MKTSEQGQQRPPDAGTAARRALLEQPPKEISIRSGLVAMSPITSLALVEFA